jgi:hypothetical protein
VAVLKITGDRLILRLNLGEKLMDLRLRSPTVPLGAVRKVEVLEHPRQVLAAEVDFGFAGNTAPLGGIVTATARAKFRDGRAAVFVYLRRKSVRVDIGLAGGRWRLFLVSCGNPDHVAAELRAHLDGRAKPPSETDTSN